MNKLPWFRLYGEIIDDEKLLLLAFEDRWHYIAILACKSRGLLDKDEDPELTQRKLALKLGLARRELDEVARRLSEVGLIDRATLQPTGWDERQFKSDSSSERVAKFRERMKSKRACNVSETAQDTEQSRADPSETTSPQVRRASRLPANWMPGPDLLKLATERGLTGQALVDEVDKFRDYWLAKAGKDGTKLDWDATFRNWIRTATKHTARGAAHDQSADPLARRRGESNFEWVNRCAAYHRERGHIPVHDHHGDPVGADDRDVPRRLGAGSGADAGH